MGPTIAGFVAPEDDFWGALLRCKQRGATLGGAEARVFLSTWGREPLAKVELSQDGQPAMVSIAGFSMPGRIRRRALLPW